MAISKEHVRHVAQLARLRLTDGELERMTVDLGHILTHVAQLQELDTTGVEPTRHVALERMPMRGDEPRAGLDHDAALRSAPRAVEGGFAVPGFVDD